MASSVSSLAYSGYYHETADERAQRAGYTDAAQMRGRRWLAEGARCVCGSRGEGLRYFVGRSSAFPDVLCDACWSQRSRNGHKARRAS